MPEDRRNLRDDQNQMVTIYKYRFQGEKTVYRDNVSKADAKRICSAPSASGPKNKQGVPEWFLGWTAN